MAARLGVGIVGTGWVAGEHLRAFDADPRSEVRAICGTSIAKAEALGARCRTKCAAYDDYQRMLDQADVDVVAIATPPNCHSRQAIAAARAGKHLLLEKAMATTLDDARAIRDVVAASGVRSVVSFVLRWNPLFEIIKAQLADNAIGRVFLGEVDYFHGIGPWYAQYRWNVRADMGVSSLLSAGCHAVDAVRWFMGGDVVEVTQYATRGDAPDFAAYEYPPTTVTILRFGDGRIGKVTSCIECIQPYVFAINLVGTDGSIRNNGIYSRTKLPGQTSWAHVPTVLPDSGDVTHHPFTHEAAHLLDCIERGVESHCGVADAWRTHAVCFAADQSGAEGRPVEVPAS